MIEPNDYESVAAEYVLGTLEADERSQLASQRLTDPKLEEIVTAWELELSPLIDLIPDATPSSAVFLKITSAIDALIMASPPRPKTRYFSLGMALAASLLLLVFAVPVLFFNSPTKEDVAELSSGNASPMFVVRLNEKAATLNIHRVMEVAAADKDYELWVIPAGKKTPLSLGVLSSADVHLTLDPSITSINLMEATLAVSLEPHGGSPTHLPTGPVLVTGKFKQTTL